MLREEGIYTLILTRRTGETIKIGADVAVTVLGVKGNQVRIGVAAPKTTSVHREEIYQRIADERAAAATTSLREEFPRRTQV